MSSARALLAVLTGLGVLLAVAACGSGDPGAVATAVSPGETGPSSVTQSDGLCEQFVSDVMGDSEGAADEEQAHQEFLRVNPELADEGITVEGGRLVRDGEDVGFVELSPAPAGGVYVEYAEWCL